VGIAKVPHTALAKLGCALGATGLPFHSFLASDSEAADISHFDLFTGFEIGAQVWRCNRGRCRGRACPSCSARLGFGSCLRFRFCLRLGFVLGFHGWVARAVGWADDSHCLTLAMEIR